MSPHRNYAPYNVFVIRKSLRYRVSVTVNSTVLRVQCKINCKLSQRFRSDLYQHAYKLHVYRIRSARYIREKSAFPVSVPLSTNRQRKRGARPDAGPASPWVPTPTRFQSERERERERVGERNSYLRSLRCDVENEIPLI